MKNIVVFSCLVVLLSGMQVVQGMKFKDLSVLDKQLCSALYNSGLDNAFVGRPIQVHTPSKGSYLLTVSEIGSEAKSDSVARQAQLIKLQLQGLNETVAVSFDKENNVLDIYKTTVYRNDNIDIDNIFQTTEEAKENQYTLDIKPLLRRSTDIDSVPESEEEKKPIATYLLVKQIQAPKEALEPLHRFSYIKVAVVGFAFLILIGAIVRCNFFK